MKTKQLALTIALLVLTLFVIVNYIYLQHKSRNQFVALQELINEENDLNADWGRLQIEQSTYVNNSTIVAHAKKQLGMKLPEKEQILSIKR
jgi:cell division protein FtsL